MQIAVASCVELSMNKTPLGMTFNTHLRPLKRTFLLEDGRDALTSMMYRTTFL